MPRRAWASCATHADWGGLSCRWRSQSTRAPAGSAASSNSVPSAPNGGFAQDAARALPRPASSCASAAARSAGRPTAPAARRPAQRASNTAAVIRSGAAVPTAPATGAAGGARAKEAGLCTSCGLRRPADEPLRLRAMPRGAGASLDRRRYDARRAAGRCVRCAQPAVRGTVAAAAAASALEKERVSPDRQKQRQPVSDATSDRRARGDFVWIAAVHVKECSARCQRCAYRSNSRAPERHLAALWPPQITVIELQTLQELGTFETEAEAAACIAFARLHPDQVEILSNVPLLALPPAMSAASPQTSRTPGRLLANIWQSQRSVVLSAPRQSSAVRFARPSGSPAGVGAGPQPRGGVKSLEEGEQERGRERAVRARSATFVINSESNRRQDHVVRIELRLRSSVGWVPMRPSATSPPAGASPICRVATDESPIIEKQIRGPENRQDRVAPGGQLPERPDRHAGEAREEGPPGLRRGQAADPEAGGRRARTPTASPPRSCWSPAGAIQFLERPAGTNGNGAQEPGDDTAPAPDAATVQGLKASHFAGEVRQNV